VLPMLSLAHVLYDQHRGPAALGVAVAVYLWSFIAVAIGTIISGVTYSLQEQVREARQLGQYILEAKIGEGGMGVVYRARHAMLRRPTAIKLLPQGKTRERDLARFEREVQMTSRLTHPNTISVYDYGRTPDGIFYYAMELLDGVDLDRLVRAKGPLPPGRAVHVLAQVCGALSEAHENGLIHRDIKPSNVFLCRQGGAYDVAKVLDFGLVRDLGNEGIDPGLSLAGAAAGAIIGTPHYLAPEAIARPDRVDARSDLYAVGCLGYYLLTGQPPFDGHSFVELCGHHLHTPAPPVSLAAPGPVPPPLEALIAACLAKDPAGRPADARLLRQGILACADGRWNDEEARAWWTTNASWLGAVASGAVTPSSELGATLAVDPRARGPVEPSLSRPD
jgi:serine/threonine protein kinase